MLSEIEAVRKKIDEIDRQILELVKCRLDLVREIVEIKRRKNLPLTDTAREMEIVKRAKEAAKSLGIDPAFAESLMWLLISHSWGKEREEMEPPELLRRLEEKFREYPAQLKVAKLMLRYGLRVNEKGEICCGSMRIPAVQIGKEAGVDRRAVEQTASRILKDEELRLIFSELEPVAHLRGAAKALGMGIIEIVPEDASRPGIIKDVAEKISKFGVSIRQAIADDPKLTPQPKLTIVTDRPLSGEVLEAIRQISYIKSVVLY
jgi:chorismate mutase